MPITEPKCLLDTFSVDVLDDYGTKLLTAYGESTITAKYRAIRAESSLTGSAPNIANLRSDIDQHTVYVHWVGNLSIPVEEPYITIADLNDILEKYSTEVES